MRTKNIGIGWVVSAMAVLLLAGFASAERVGEVAGRGAQRDLAGNMIPASDSRHGVVADGTTDGKPPASGVVTAAPWDSGRVIVQFAQPSLAEAKAANAAAAMPVQEHEQFRADLASIRGGLAQGKQLVRPADVQFRREYVTVFNGVALSLTEAERGAVSKLPYVKAIFPDAEVEAYLAESVPLIHADDVWNSLGTNGTGRVVAVIDTGIDYNHPDLGGGMGVGFKVLGGYDFVNSDADPMDDHGHGTHCAGIVAASGSIVGVAPGASLMGYKVLGADGRGWTSDIIAGIERACDPDENPGTDDAVDVISMSLGSIGTPDDAKSQAIDNAVGLGVVCAVAAGNDGQYETIGSPGCAREALTVGATDKWDAMAYFSSLGPAAATSDIKPEVCAPGHNILSAQMGGGTVGLSGTSMATPHVAGAAALLLALHPAWTPAQVKSALMATAVDLGQDVMVQGAGRIDVYAAAQTEILLEPGSLNLGYDDLSLGTWSVTKTLTATNVSPGPVMYAFSVDTSELPPGVTTSITPSISLGVGASTTITFQVTVDNSMVPNLYEAPYVYWGFIQGESGVNTVRLPFAFNKEQPDSMEPNNTFAEATTVAVTDVRRQVKALGRTKINPLEPGASNPDEDWYTFPASAGQVLFAYVIAYNIGSPFYHGTLELYDSTQTLLQSAEMIQYDPRIISYPIPADGAYYLRVAGGAFPGPYRLYLNVLPQEVDFHWTPAIPTGGKPVDFARFSDGGDYLAACEYFNRLVLFEIPGTGTPVYTLTGGSSTFLAASANSSVLATVLTHRFSNDTWTYDAIDWNLEPTAADPGHLWMPAMAFDAARGQSVFLGGRDDTAFYGDTWLWDGSAWTMQSPATSPGPRTRAAMAYDSARQVVVLFGGLGGSPDTYWYLNDTWEWDGTDWTQVITANAPAPRYSPLLAFDSARGVSVLYGGGGYSDTWEYDGTDWTERSPVTSPGATSGFIAYDAARNETVLATGMPVETWTWDGITWTHEAPATVPQVYPMGMVFDSSRSRVVMLGTSVTNGYWDADMRTWEWDGSDWTQSVTLATPGAREAFALTYDALRQETVLYGGERFYSDQFLEVRTTPSSTAVFTDTLSYPNTLTGLYASADGTRLICPTGNETIEVRQGNGAIIKTISYPRLRYLDWVSPNGRLAVVISDQNGGQRMLLDLDTELERPCVVAGNWDSQAWSADGTRVVSVASNLASLYEWNGTAYVALWEIQPEYGRTFESMTTISDDGSTIMAAKRDAGSNFWYCLIDGDTGEVLWSYYVPLNKAMTGAAMPARMQLNGDGSLAMVTIRHPLGSGWTFYQYDDVLAFSPHCGVPIFEFGLPGVASSCDLSGTRLAVGSGVTHESIFDSSGEVYSIDLAANLANVPPNVTETEATPWSLDPAETVTITCRASDPDGVAGVVAEIEAPDENGVASLTLYDDGAHGDSAAGDGVWGNTWVTGPIPAEYVVDITATDGLGSAATYDSVARFTTAAAPWVKYHGCVVQEHPNLRPGTWNNFTLSLQNEGTMRARNVVAELTTEDPFIWGDWRQWAYFGDMQPGASGDYSSLNILLSSQAPHGHVISVTLTITAEDGYVWAESFDLPPVGDDVGPEITECHISGHSFNPGDPVTVTARAVDGSGPIRVFVTFWYGGLDVEVDMYDDGNHDDGAAGDGVYGATWTTLAEPYDFTASVQATDARDNTSWGCSLSFTTIPFVKTADILLVGGQGWGYEQSVYRETLDSLGVEYDVWPRSLRGEIPASIFIQYIPGIVIWSQESADMAAITPGEQQALIDHLDSGGNLLMSGHGLLQNLSGTELMETYLHASLVQYGVGLLDQVGVAGDPIGDGLSLSLAQYSGMCEVDVTPPAYPVLTYVPGSGGGSVVGSGTAAFRVEAAYKAAVLGFPVGDIAGDSTRETLLARILYWFGLDLPPRSFAWAPVASPQTESAPFPVEVTALDAGGHIADTFAGAVSLVGVTGVGEVQIGSSESEIYALQGPSRMQTIYTAEEIGQAGQLTTLGLDVRIPWAYPITVSRMTIRMKHTPLSEFAAGTWDESGWTTVYQADVTLTESGWTTFSFSTPFDYNGTDNLMVDLSGPSSWDALICAGFWGSTYRSMAYADYAVAYGDPLLWTSGAPEAYRSSFIPRLRLGGADRLPVEPAMASGFVNGVWSGTVSMGGEGADVRLRAAYSDGYFGESNSFTLLGAVAPVAAITGPIAATNAVRTLTVDFGETVTGFSIEDVVVTNGVAGNLRPVLPSFSYEVDVTGQSVGTVSVSIPDGVAHDLGGRPNVGMTEPFTFPFDNEPPTVTVSLTGAQYTTADVLEFDIVFNEDVGATFDADDLFLNGELTGTVNVSGASPVFSVSVVLDDPDANGWAQLTVCGDIRDLAGNICSCASEGYYLTNWHGFASPPQNARGYTGDYAYFSVDSWFGWMETLFQWKWEDTDHVVHDGPTGALWDLWGLSEANLGEYWCEVTYDGVLHESPHATLEVRDHLEITQQPIGGNKAPGEAHTFIIATTGGYAPLSYQWKKDDANIAGATGASYTITGLATTDTGAYSVEVSDSNADALTSAPATLTVANGVPAAGALGLWVLAPGMLIAGALALAGTMRFGKRG